MAYERKSGWIATVWSGPDHGGKWAHLTISFRMATRTNAAREASNQVGRSDEKFYRDRLLSVREANKAADVDYGPQRDKYWDANYCSGTLSIRWQANLPGWDSLDRCDRKASGWYAPKVELDRLSDTRAARLLAKLAKLDRDASPQAVLEASKAIVVESLRDVMSGYVEATPDTALVSPEEKADAEAEAQRWNPVQL